MVEDAAGVGAVLDALVKWRSWLREFESRLVVSFDMDSKVVGDVALVFNIDVVLEKINGFIQIDLSLGSKDHIVHKEK